MAMVTVAPLGFMFEVDFGVGSSGASQTVHAGGMANYNLDVTPTYSIYPGTVSFNATGLPAGATVSFSPKMLSPEAGAQVIKMTIQLPNVNATVARSQNPFKPFIPVLMGSLLLPLLGLRRIRKNGMWRGLLLALLLLNGLAGVTTLSGCGTGFYSGELYQMESYTITVTATSANITHNIKLKLTIL